MADEFDEKLCIERHKTIDHNIDDLWKFHGELSRSINGKFNKIMFSILGTLLTVIASMVVIIFTRH